MDDDVQIKLILAVSLVFLYTVAIIIIHDEQFTEIVLTLITNVLVGFFTYNLTKRANKHKR
jgi:hypothetical protein